MVVAVVVAVVVVVVVVAGLVKREYYHFKQEVYYLNLITSYYLFVEVEILHLFLEVYNLLNYLYLLSVMM
jgi:hypothetical protein